MLVFALASGLGFYLSKPGESLLPSALIGAAVSLLVTAATAFLAEPGAIPFQFNQAAAADFKERGYFRSENVLAITMAEDNTITFSMTSKIVRFSDNALLKPLTIKPPPGLTVGRQSYRLSGREIDTTAETPINKNLREELTVVYRFSAGFSGVSDTHTWDCPVDGFRIVMTAPAGFQVGAKTLSGRNLEEQGALIDRCRTYVEDRAAFSHQGFIWTIRSIP